MRVVVTGVDNATGSEIASALVAAGHSVRTFGDGQVDGARWHPGDLRVSGSIEPVLSEREALVHVACIGAGARMVEMGTLYARYGAEREQLDHFIHVHPVKLDGPQTRAIATARATRGVHVALVEAGPGAVQAVLDSLTQGGRLGKQPGRDTDAVTA